MRRAHLYITLILTLGILQGALAQDRKNAGPDPAEWVPAEAIVYVGITDMQHTWANYQKTLKYKSMTDPEMAEVGGMPNIGGAVLKKVKERLGRVLDVDPDELKSPFAGPMALYATVPAGGAFDDIEPGLIAGVGDAELMKRYFDTIVARLKEAADGYESITAGGETIHVFTSEGGDGEGGEEDEFDFDEPTMGPDAIMGFIDEALDKIFSLEHLPPKMAVCLTEERLLVSRTADHIRAALARSGGSRTLADSDDHQALLRHRRPIGEVRLLVNLPRIFELAKAEGADQDELQSKLRVIGAQGLRSLVGHMRLSTKSYDTKLELMFLMRGERSGLAKLLSMENRPVSPPDSVQAAAGAYVCFNIDPPKLLDEILNMVAQEDPESAEQARAGMEEVPLGEHTVNIRKDLFDHLSGPLALDVTINKPYGAGSLKALVTLGHRNREALSRFFSILPNMAPPRDFQGTQIFPNANGLMHFAIAADRILAGNQAAVETALSATATESLAEEANFRRAKRLVPEEAWGTIYFDGRKMLEGLMGLTAKQAELVGDPAGMITGMLAMAGVDFSDTPQNRKMLEYTSVNLFTVATTPDGVQLTYVVLKAEQE
ncbi:MAG: hypothetical protein ABIG44_06675 [Planctomycetota bacterium]